MTDDDLTRRLAAADPAADAAPDLDRLRAKVADRLTASADPGPGQPDLTPTASAPPGPALPPAPPPTLGEPAAVVHLDQRPRRSRFSPARAGWVAAAAALALVFAGGGYVLSQARSGGDGSSAAGAASPTRPDADAAAPTAAPPDRAQPTHVPVGLSDVGGTGTVYQVGPTDVDRAQAERYAQAWGVGGPVASDGDGWSAHDGGRTVRITTDGGLVRVELTDTSAPGPSSGDVAAARAVLAAAGVDLTGQDVTTSGGTVTFRRLVDGQPTTLGWQVETGPSGPRRIVGTLGGQISPRGQYPLLSPATAVARLDDTAFRGWPATMPADDGTVVTGWTDQPPPPGATTVEVTEAHLGLALDASSGTALLVPAYALTSAQTTALVPALTDEDLSRL